LDREPDFGDLDDEAGCLNVVIQLAFGTGEEHRDIELSLYAILDLCGRQAAQERSAAGRRPDQRRRTDSIYGGPGTDTCTYGETLFSCP